MVSNARAGVSLSCTYGFRSLLASARTARSPVETSCHRSSKDGEIAATSLQPDVGQWCRDPIDRRGSKLPEKQRIKLAHAQSPSNAVRRLIWLPTLIMGFSIVR
jgi:hypothetical protein